MTENYKFLKDYKLKAIIMYKKYMLVQLRNLKIFSKRNI